jgi:D-sedoheptulose 7-phosphate isomerase
MERVKNLLNISADLKKTVAETLSSEILDAAQKIQDRLESGGKLMLMGNGGSAADAQHIAAELVGRFKKERKAMPALALTVDTSSLTALGNDYGFDTIFERQVEALTNKNDAVIGISTSGNSENIIRAVN